MMMLEALEERVNQLLVLAADTTKKNKDLQTSNEHLKSEIEDLRADNAKFAEDNAQLTAQLRAIEVSLEQENEHMHALSEEKTLAKIVVDDLIKSIDALIERENQQ